MKKYCIWFTGSMYTIVNAHNIMMAINIAHSSECIINREITNIQLL